MIDTEKIKPIIRQLAEKYQLSLVALFGSQASGKTHPQSDVDLAFMPEKRMDLMDTAKMQMDFSEKLRIKNLEMVNLKIANPLLLNQVAQKSALLYEKEQSAFALFKIYALKLFMEAKPLFDLREKSLNKFLKQ